MLKCRHCGATRAHTSRECPHKGTPGAATPPPHAASSLQTAEAPPAIPGYWLAPELLRRPPEEIADYEKWGKIARAVLGMDDGPLIDTPFRRSMRIPPRTEQQLREIAAEQVRESRRQHAMPGVDNQP